MGNQTFKKKDNIMHVMYTHIYVHKCLRYGGMSTSCLAPTALVLDIYYVCVLYLLIGMSGAAWAWRLHQICFFFSCHHVLNASMGSGPSQKPVGCKPMTN